MSEAMLKTKEDEAPIGTVRVGKDLLELISSAMYVEPLTAYREYLQNAADSLDEARQRGLLAGGAGGRIEIELDQVVRSVRIRDNGAVPPAPEAIDRLLALGGSAKRGTAARGFRGVGRLAALGYAQFLIFRTRAEGEARITEVIWDARKLRTALADPAIRDLADIIREVVEIRTIPADDRPARFFEVEIGRIVRQRGDRLLDPAAVEAYVAQIAPVPFAADFSHGSAITSALRAAGPLGEFEVTIDGGPPLTRPHQDIFGFGAAETHVHEVRVVELPGQDGGLAAIAWFAHHDYRGAIASAALVKGVRVRVGNIQVGDQTILEQIFPESRFNSWTVGEVHVFDQRIVPNGRRDEFEANAHYANLVNQLSPIGRDIARRCRTSSTLRSKLRAFELTSRDVDERLGIIEQGVLTAEARASELSRIAQSVEKMKKVAAAEEIDPAARDELARIAVNFEAKAARASGGATGDPLDMIDPSERETYRQMFDLIYECSVNRVAAKSLVDKIITRLAA